MQNLAKWITAFMILLFFVMVGGFFLPSQWKVERSISIHADPVTLYPLVSDLKTGWPQWSAFEADEPQTAYQYSGPGAGTGSSRTWSSKKMGATTQTITAADPRRVEFELKMDGGYIVLGVMTLEPTGDQQTRVTWTDYGDVGQNPFARYKVIFLDKIIGNKFEKSLANLKQKAEQK